jgi:hypothetical protein
MEWSPQAAPGFHGILRCSLLIITTLKDAWAQLQMTSCCFLPTAAARTSGSCLLHAQHVLPMKSCRITYFAGRTSFTDCKNCTSAAKQECSQTGHYTRTRLHNLHGFRDHWCLQGLSTLPATEVGFDVPTACTAGERPVNCRATSWGCLPP